MRVPTLLVLLAATTTFGCTSIGHRGDTASATLESRSGSTVLGTATFRQRYNGVHVRVDVNGLVGGSEHGFHVHDKGDCSAPDAASAGGHFNPTAVAHGKFSASVHHSGDLPSLVADSNGRARLEFDLPGATLDAGPGSIMGHSVVVHGAADDFTTQPSGNSGARVACGVIQAK